jgi:tetratricopeptide (TPR) repeat protein
MTIEAPDVVPPIGGSMDRDPSPSGTHAAGRIPRSGEEARRATWGRRLWRWGRWILLLSLLGLNAWWLGRDARPVVALDVIARWTQEQRDREAEQALRQRLARSPHDGDSRVLLAKLLARRHDTLGCARELHQVPFWWPDKGRWLLMEAGAFKECDRMRDAEAAWKIIAAEDPFHPVDPKYVTAAIRDLMELYAVEGRWDEMVQLIWTTYDRTDDPVERENLLNMRLRTELERILPAVAAEKMEKYLAADPRDWEARRGLAKAKLALNLPEEARRHIEVCREERPEDPRGWADGLDVLHTMGDLDGLRQTVARLPASVAEHPAVLTHRARLLERDRRWPEAAEVYRRILQGRRFELETYYRLALVEDRLGQHEPAQVHRQRWEAMRTARTELNAAYQKVLDLHQSDPKSSRYHAAVRRLAQLCKILGWSRDAEGWSRVAPPT